MVTIVGNGMGDYDFSNISLDFTTFDKIVCDKNFKIEGENILKGGYKTTRDYILQNYEKENILYVVTGSPFFFSAGILLANKLPKDKVIMIDNKSSKTYMQEKLFISDNDIDTISLHGRINIDLTKFLTNTYTFILCDKDTILRTKEAIKYLNQDEIEVFIGYKLGFEDEVIKQINIFDDDSYKNFDNKTQPYVLVIKRLFQTNGLSKDDDFDTQRGMITKEYKRNLSLQNLDLEPNQLLWDIGAGSGSCGIEAYKRYKVKTIFFEKQELRCGYIKQNLKKHKVIDTKLLEGNAQDLFETLEQNPQRIFVGGGGEEVIKKLPYLFNRLENNGVMVISAITLLNLTQMISVLKEANIKYEIFSLSLTTYKGKLDLIEPQRQLFQIKIKK